MSDVHTLLARCQELGAILTPGSEGQLKVKAPAPWPDSLRQELLQHKAEVLALLAQSSAPWPCPACGGAIRLDPPGEYLPTRFWACGGCGAWGATRESATYPVVWIGSGGVQ